MSFNFVEKNLIIGQEGDSLPPFQFYRRGFVLGGSGSPSWQDIILSGNTALTLVNAKENGLNYLKLFGGTKQNGTPSPDAPIDIVCNNGVIKVSPNLFGGYTTETGYWQSDGTWSTDSNYNSYQYITLKPNTTYTISNDVAPDYWRLALFNGNTFSSRLLQQSGTSYTFTTNASENKISIAFNKNNISDVSKVQLELGSTPTSYMSYGQIYADGTTETVELHSVNLFDVGALTRNAGYMVSTVNGSFNDSDQYTRSDYIPVLPNTQYIRTTSGAASTVYFDINKNFLSSRTGTSFTTPADCYYVMYNVKNSVDYSQGMMVKGDELPTTYEPYYYGGQATAEMLLKIGDYKDEQEVLAGNVTRNVGIKVLDGTEDWLEGGESGQYNHRFSLPFNATDNANGTLCTHIDRIIQNSTTAQSIRPCIRISLAGTSIVFYTTDNTTTLAEFKQFLADQYNAGHPVVVVYPLATATTESVTGQPLTIQAGTNIVEITQTSIDNLGLEVSYKATV